MPADPAVALAPEPSTDAVPVWNATLEAIVTSPGHDYWGKRGEGRMQHGVRTPTEARLVAQMGIEGDRYFGEKPGGRGQVTFFDAEVVDAVRAEFRLPRLPASVFRRNLIVRGVEGGLARWLDRVFDFQGVRFEGAQECRPCQWMDRAVSPGAQDFLREHFRGGLRARVLAGGVLRVGRAGGAATGL